MKRVMMAGLALLCVGASEDNGPKLPGWMAGCWIQEKGDRWTEECWTAPRGGRMMGSSLRGRGDKTAQWEQVRIELSEGGMAYIASPGGGAPTTFKWEASKDSGLTFLNAAHDYPQRIRYWREGEMLMAEISLADGSKPMRWAYAPVK